MGSELLDDILAVLKVAQHKADGSITFWCPFHPDGQGNPPHTPNGVIKPGNKGASYVWACPVCDIGGTLLDLADRLRQGGMMPPRESNQSDAKIVKTYPYHDEQGRLLFEVLRRSNKSFCQRRPDGKGDWLWKLDTVRRAPYRLPELLAADPGQWIFIPEGEKDCNNLALVGLVATTNPGGAGKWREEFGPYLKGRKVTILPDNDAPGQAHAEDVAAKIAPYAAEVRIVSLPDLPPGGDVSDWLNKGHTAGELAALVEHAPSWSSDIRPPDITGTPILARLADVDRQEVSWLWEGRLPRGRLTILDGDPGVGKSWLALAIATAITRGTSLPGQESAGEPANVLLLTAEDGLADTVRPRLEDMGADLKGVTVLTAVHDKEGNERHLSLVDDLAALDMALAPGGYGLVIIDPINAYLGIALDTHRDAALRSVLTPLAQLAERWGVAIICIRHLTKSGRDKAIYRGQGNIAYAAAARVVHLVGVNPDDPQERVMACIKNNLAPESPTLAFELTDGRFLWRGETNVTAAALLRPEVDDGERRSALAEAQDFLRELLADGPVEAEEGWRQARKLGISERTLTTARGVLGVLARREGFGPGGRWLWKLPEEEHRRQTPHTIETLLPMEGPDTKQTPTENSFAAYGQGGEAEAPDEDEVPDANDGEGDDAVPPEFTGKRHYVVALGIELDFPNVCWPGGGIPAGRYYYEQAARFFTDADIEKAVAALEARAAGRRGSDA